MSPTQRTLAYFRKQGFSSIAITEHWNQWAKIRQDLFGMIDIIVLRPGQEMLGVQCTSDTNHAARVKKVLANEHVLNWTMCADLQVISWSKGAREPRITHIFYDDSINKVSALELPKNETPQRD
jgi:hypothetical protein